MTATAPADLLRFICVGRLMRDSNGELAPSKHILLCSLSSGAKDVESQVKLYKQHVKAIMTKSALKLVPGKRIRLTSDEGNDYELHVLADQPVEEDVNEIIIFFAVTSVEFSKHHPVANLMRDFREGFHQTVSSQLLQGTTSNGGLNKTCSSLLGKLFTQYGSSILVDVSLKVEEVKNVMKENVNKALDNVEQLEEMEAKSEQLDEQARLFEKGSVKMKSLMKCRYYKLQIIICLMVTALAAYIIYAVSAK